MTLVPESSHGFNGGTITGRLRVVDPVATHIGVEVDAPAGSIANAWPQLFITDENGNTLFSVAGDGSVDLRLEATGTPTLTMGNVNAGSLFTFSPNTGSGGATFGWAMAVAGNTITFSDHLGAKVFEIRDDGSLHGKTGKALTFDL